MIRRIASLALPLALVAGSAHALTAETATRADGKVVVTWTDADPVDVYVANRADATVAQAKLVSAANKDGRFEFEAAAARPYFLLRDGGDRRVTRVAERVLPLQQGSNFRDLGGYPAAGGKHVKWGRIYRSGATPMLTKADVDLVRSLDLEEMVDLRSNEERVLAPSKIEGVRYTAVGYSMTSLMNPSQPLPGTDQMQQVYGTMPTLLAPQLRILFQDLIAGRGGAIAYNCSAGQDRTGFTTALILTALGVPRDQIVADYHLSTTYRRPEFEMPKFDAATKASNPVAAMFSRYQDDPAAARPQPLKDAQGRAFVEFALAAVETQYGSVDAYLEKALGVTAADRMKLRAMYTE